MSKLGCKCGHVIIDQTDSLPYKAEFTPDKLSGILYEEVFDDLAGLMRAVQEGRREAWIEAYFTRTYAQLKLSDHAIIADIFNKRYLEYFRTMYQCEKCGRILIQKEDTHYYQSFLPESEDAQGILNA